MSDLETDEIDARGGQMSFLEHLDELRRRLVNCVIIIVIALVACWFVSDHIFAFLSVPIRQAISDAERRSVPLEGLSGDEAVRPGTSLAEGDEILYIFDRPTKIGTAVVAAGTSVKAVATKGPDGAMGLYLKEALFAGNVVIPEGIRLPAVISDSVTATSGEEERLIVTTAAESFTLLVTVSLYSAIAVSLPFLLLQVWGFISPALYKHERAYVTPFVLLSSISFIIGAAFAYYILFPPAVRYLLSLGEDFRILLRATDYFDFITLIMLAMGLIFQMPAITYVLARIGIVNARFLIKSWKLALVIILIVAAVVSPTGDIPNMMLFATPMMGLYVVSIGIAWFFGRKRQRESST